MTGTSSAILASGLRFPEGPVAFSDGSLVLVELAGGCVTRLGPDGAHSVVSRTGGGPNGAALGPDGTLYVCNNGGFAWGAPDPFLPAADYQGGWIEKVSLKTGEVQNLYHECGGHRLSAPNDLVFDSQGGFYFTDSGKGCERQRDYGAVYYAATDGSHISRIIFPMIVPNGIGLSPDGRVLYVAETETARLWAFDLDAPGIVRRHGGPLHGGRLIAGLGGYQRFDSLAVDTHGNIYIATLVTGAITVVTPRGDVLAQVPVGDPDVTNLCFGGVDRRSIYVTRGGLGDVLAIRWGTAGLPLAFEI